jgi:hypothetical protein
VEDGLTCGWVLTQKRARRVQSEPDRHVPVQVTIGSEPAHEGDFSLGSGTRHIMLAHRVLMDQVHGIVRNVAGLAGTTELAVTRSLLGQLGRAASTP